MMKNIQYSLSVGIQDKLVQLEKEGVILEWEDEENESDDELIDEM